ncbi:RNA-binding S4 domain-containing protein, partial [Latilactobacillus sakei]
IIETGGKAKWFLRENTVLVNGEPDDRRGRKLYPEDVIEVPDNGQFIVKQQERL